MMCTPSASILRATSVTVIVSASTHTSHPALMLARSGDASSPLPATPTTRTLLRSCIENML
eukprot:CAMPEP_0171998586 /NCGR_PEP_ID=MMETSP1041-20130122/1318_1 /TAXON_ID=464988 /ORGANISM="Hemiselmis andersenii, Strain CCMP439" /LENGTH=60 /DNA_ID=CAMNT_0012651975 /DNA_START=1025 /DNA_END=1204 /DNA_ORIENTATION=-